MIRSVLSSCGVLVLYFLFYYMTGSLVLHFFPSSGDTDRFSGRLILGFFVYSLLFSIAALPMKLTLQPLSSLSRLWAVILAGLTFLFLVLESRSAVTRIKAAVSSFRKKPSSRKWYEAASLFLLLAILLFQVIWFNLNDETYAIWDQSYFLGDTATSLYTNTISQYDCYTGNQLKYLHTEYLLETYQNLSSVMCQLLSLHPMIEVLTIMASAVIILYQLVFYEIGMILFRKDRLRSAIMVGFLFFLNLYSYNLHAAGEFLIIRPSEGKTILAVLILPAILWLFLKKLSQPQNKACTIQLFLLISGCFGLNMSSVFMIPFELTSLYLPYFIKKKKLSILIEYLILLLPCILYSVGYLITKSNLKIYTGA